MPKPTIKYEELPEKISPKEYAAWRGIGKMQAYERFHEKGFPLIKSERKRLEADKRAVLVYELGIDEKTRKELLLEVAKQML